MILPGKSRYGVVGPRDASRAGLRPMVVAVPLRAPADATLGSAAAPRAREAAPR